MPRDLPRTAAHLETIGMGTLLQQLLQGPLPETREYNFSTLTIAKRVMSLLYSFMWFYPEIKARTSMRLNNETATLYIMPRTISEKRGRRKL